MSMKERTIGRRKTAALWRTRLSLPLTSFVGRKQELAEVKQLLSSVRLLTLTGPGGCGKSRLALQVAGEYGEAFEDGITWVDLVGLSESALVTLAVVRALDLREASHESPLETLTHYLKAKHLLLVLDNCEHLLAACQELVKALLLACPNLQVLATSREPLAIEDELTWLVPALSLPDARLASRRDDRLLADLERYDAIRLFVERAQSVLPTFTLTNQNRVAVVQVCQRLDGMPLAIELAAARVNVLAVQQIAARLDNRFSLLTGGNRTALIPRHQTLRATMDWSHDLLSEPERILFRRLAVFAGGFTLEAAEAIGAGEDIQVQDVLDLLAHLVDKSLVVAETQRSSEAHYRLLETIRQYAFEKLQASGKETLLRRHHCDWFLALAEQAEPRLRGPEQMVWLDRLESEYDNLRAALVWSRAESRAKTSAATDSEEAELRLASALFWFWDLRGYWSEGRHWLEDVLEQQHDESGHMAARAKALYAAGELARLQGDHATEQHRCEQSVAIWRNLLTQFEAADREAPDEEKTRLLPQLKRGLALALCGLGRVAFYSGDYATAHSLVEESLGLSRSIGAKWELGYALLYNGEFVLYEGDYATACSLLEQSLTAFRETADKWGFALALHARGQAALALADYSTARARFEEGLAIHRQLGDKWNIAYALNQLGETERSQGDDVRALPLYEETVAIHRELGSKWGLCFSLHNLGYIALHRGDSNRAAELFKEALSLNLERQDSLGTASCLAGLAGVATISGTLERATQLFGKVQALLDQIGLVLASADRRELERNMAVARALLDPETFTLAWEAGRTLTLDQAVEKALSAGTEAHSDHFPALVEPLNEREREMLRLIADGLSNHEIAERLVIALSTVKWHINNLFGKLSVRSRTQALVRAKELGLL